MCAELCGECSSRAESLLEEGRISDAGRTEELLESWAAAEAFYQLALTDEASLPESVSADGVQIQWGERSRKAKALAAEKRRNLSSALGEEEFYFGRA